MSSRSKILIAAAVVTVLFVGAAAAFAATVWNAGMLVVDVREKHEGGTEVHVRLPAAVIPAALTIVPDRTLAAEIDCDEDFRGLEVASAVLHELRDVPDAELVSVESDTEVVRVRKRGKVLVIDVDTPHERVHVEMPIDALGALAKKLERVRDAA